MMIFIGLALMPIALLFYLYKEGGALETEKIKKIESVGLIGYEGAIVLLKLYNEKEAELLLKKWYREHNSEDFKNQITYLELMLSHLPGMALNYSLKDVISSAKLYASIYLATKAIRSHKDILRRKCNQLVYKDDYGNLILEDWNNEVSYFYKNVLEKDIDYKKCIKSYVEPFFFSKCTEYSLTRAPDANIKKRSELTLKMVGASLDYFGLYINSNEIEAVIRDGGNNKDLADNLINPTGTTPIEYEKYCEGQLTRGGWDASVTKNGADQGVDILATKDSFTLVVQCKNYNNPVGNKAVQEIISSREYYKADAAAVVTNSPYTKSAKQLASASNVKLLHHSQLNQLTPDDFECLM